VKKASQFIVLSLFGLFLSQTVSAQALQNFTLVNKTGVVINELHIAPSTMEEWGEDILGVDVLDSDQQCDVSFHPKEDVCEWDLKVTDSEGNYLEWDNIDLCQYAVITLYWDAESGTGSAEFE